MPDNEQPVNEANLVELAQREGVHLEVNPEDTVPFRPQPVFISLGLKREVFLGQSGGNSTTSVPPIDLTTEDGQLSSRENGTRENGVSSFYRHGRQNELTPFIPTFLN